MVQVTQVRTERGLGLHDDFVGLAEFIEVIDIQGAHLGLQGHKYLIERNPEVLRLNTVYIDEVLRHISAVGTEYALQARRLVTIDNNIIEHSGQFRRWPGQRIL